MCVDSFVSASVSACVRMEMALYTYTVGIGDDFLCVRVCLLRVYGKRGNEHVHKSPERLR